VAGVGVIFFNFQVKMQSFMHFITKNYLWSEAGTGEGS